MKLDDVVAKIRGNAGTIVRLGVRPATGGDVVIYNITSSQNQPGRQRGPQPNRRTRQETRWLTHEGRYIDLPSFYLDMKGAKGKDNNNFKSSTRDVRNILSTFREANVDAVVIDLSRNGGGSLTEAISLTGLFIDHGPWSK